MALAKLALATLGQVLLSMLGKMVTKEFFEWAILWGAKKYVESTETKADDEWYEKLKKLMDEGK